MSLLNEIELLGIFGVQCIDWLLNGTCYVMHDVLMTDYVIVGVSTNVKWGRYNCGVQRSYTWPMTRMDSQARSHKRIINASIFFLSMLKIMMCMLCY